MNWNDAFLFVQVVEQGGFSAAARALQLPKSSIAHRIAMLEAQLGARLIQRTSRRFAPTEAGQAFLKHAKAMLAEATAAEDAVHARVAEPVGAVRITTSPGIAQAGLAEVLAGFLAVFPKVRLTQHVANRNVDLVAERFDLAIGRIRWLCRILGSSNGRWGFRRDGSSPRRTIFYASVSRPAPKTSQTISAYRCPPWKARPGRCSIAAVTWRKHERRRGFRQKILFRSRSPGCKPSGSRSFPSACVAPRSRRKPWSASCRIGPPAAHTSRS